MSSRYLVSLRVGSARHAGRLSGILGPDDAVWPAALALPRPAHHVVSRRAGNASRVAPGRAQGAAATLRGHASNHVGDVDGVDLCHVAAVPSHLAGVKHVSDNTAVGRSSCTPKLIIPDRFFLFFLFLPCWMDNRKLKLTVFAGGRKHRAKYVASLKSTMGCESAIVLY